jgi:predicted flap endonuclease-1-like 5' DNA nuclease
MANRTIAQVLKLHDKVVDSISTQLDSAGRPKPVDQAFFINQKTERLGAMKARLDDAKRDKQEVIKRMNLQLETLNKRIERLEAEIDADKRNLENRPVPVDPTPRRRDRLSVRNVRGIGEVAEARLKENGVTTTTQLARMDKARLAAILGVSEVRAAEFIKAAKLIR